MGSKTYVSSTSYNLAGDVNGRPNFLNTTAVGSTLSQSSKYMSETIINAHLNGPGVKQRTFFNWAKKNFPLGMPTAEIKSTFVVDPDVVIDQIDVPAGQEIVLNRAYIEAADFTVFAEKYILDNDPELYDTQWVADLDRANNRVVIQYEDTYTDYVPLGNFDRSKDYLVAYFHFVETTSYDALISEGVVRQITNSNNLPSIDPDMDLEDDNNDYTQTVGLAVVTEQVTTFTDGRRPTTSRSTEYPTQVWEHEHKTYAKSVRAGTDGVSGRMLNHISKYQLWKNYIIEKEVSQTTEGLTTTTVTRDVLRPVWSYEKTTQIQYLGAGVGDTQMLIYKMGSGNDAFDVLQSAADQPVNEFFPFIPLRLDNKSIRHDDYKDTILDKCTKAFKKATGGSIDEILDNIEENESIDDIDHAFLNYGVSLNVDENSAKKYLYQYLKSLIPYQKTTLSEYNDFLYRKDTYEAEKQAYDTWFAQQVHPNNPLYGTPEPINRPLVKPQFTTVKIASTSDVVDNYDMRISWVTLDEDNFIGKVKATSKIGDVTVEKGGVDSWTEGGGYRSWIRSNFTDSVETTYIYWQYAENAYRRMACKGLVHRNYVYSGNVVKITAHEALSDDEESSFIIPMHYPTLISMSIIDSTQMVTANTYITFNSYQVVKQRFFETGVFRVLLFIGVVALSIAFPPAAGASGILGSSAIVGASLGFTGSAALIAGAVANALAAIILTNIIIGTSTELFGEKWGAVIGAVASFIIMTEINAFNTNGQFGADWGSMMRSENLMKLTTSAGDVYASWINGDTLEVLGDMEQEEQEYEEQLDYIQDLNSQLNLMNGMVDTSIITDSILNPGMATESGEDFISRTTMVGSDIVDLSHSMIYDYVEMNLRLPES